MNWDYRAVRSDLNGVSCVAVHEVYYDDEGKIEAWCTKPESLEFYADLADLRESVTIMLEDATSKPILERSELPSEEEVTAHYASLLGVREHD